MADSDIQNCNGIDQMSKTLNSMKSDIEICNCFGLNKTFKSLDKELDMFLTDRKIAKDILNIYLQSLVMLESFTREILLGNSYKPKATHLTRKDLFVLCSLQIKAIKKYNKYKDFITINPSVYQLDPHLLKGQETLERLAQAAAHQEAATTPAEKVDIIMCRCMSGFGAKPFSIKRLTKLVHNLLLVIDILTQHPNILLTDVRNNFITGNFGTRKGRIQVRVNLLAVVMQICSKFTNFLKSFKPHDIERLKGETVLLVGLLNVMDYFRKKYNFSEAANGVNNYFQEERNFSEAAMDVEDYFIRKNDFSKAATVALLLIRRVYYKSQHSYETMRKLADEIEFPVNTVEKDDEHSSPSNFFNSPIVSRRPCFPEKCETLMTELVTIATMYGNDDTISHAVLYHVYHLAVMDDFSKSRDLLRNYLQHGMQELNFRTQLHLNRAVAQLGLCAYRAGLVEEAHGFLSELCAYGRVEELLFQGAVTRIGGGKAPRGLTIIRERQYDQPIDLEHLKAVYIKCCMLLEDPPMVNATIRPTKVQFLSNTVREPLRSEGRAMCGASWERVCDGRFCCSASSLNDDDDNDRVGGSLLSKWIESRGLQLL